MGCSNGPRSGRSSQEHDLETLQIISSLHWFNAFVARKGSPLERFFRLDAYCRTGATVEIGTGASPWGLGGWLSFGGRITHFFACPVASEGAAMFKITIGTADGQQIWECLAMLLALRLWQPLWAQHRLNLSVGGGNIGALTLLLKMRPHSSRHAIIARELALLTIHAPFFPDVRRTPGVAHVVADELPAERREQTDPSTTGNGSSTQLAFEGSVEFGTRFAEEGQSRDA